MRHPPTCLVEVHRLPGPQKRGTGATLIVVGIELRDRGHPPVLQPESQKKTRQVWFSSSKLRSVRARL
jgi:hypothetical protein